MTATVEIINNFSMESQGQTVTGKQGEATEAFSTAHEYSITGTKHSRIGSIATATVNKLFDEDDDLPAGFDYFHFWSDQDCYLQFIAQATNVIVKVEAYLPFVLPGFDDILAAADTTAITGGTEPTLSKIDSVYVGNYSGNAMNYTATFID